MRKAYQKELIVAFYRLAVGGKVDGKVETGNQAVRLSLCMRIQETND